MAHRLYHHRPHEDANDYRWHTGQRVDQKSERRPKPTRREFSQIEAAEDTNRHTYHRGYGDQHKAADDGWCDSAAGLADRLWFVDQETNAELASAGHRNIA